jgi:purine nucleoside permease
MIVYDSLGWQVPGRSRIEPAAHDGSCSCCAVLLSCLVAYCTTQQPDNATLAALSRGAQSGLAHLRRVALSTDKFVPAERPLMQEIVQHRDLWWGAVPASAAP